ncbi:MAG: TetR/AcrR family transcriptional regulator [Salinivirgaceae bacterium]|jgi:TetR/AcrR family transcriptional regulator|nr:TetR/AcrR family transcriptional regulator [Salinivirgaceae bacterium]
MTNKEKQTEEIIAEAAREVFVEKGMAGARMQEIADKAGINKSLLHYYFRSKDKLFDFVFSKIMGKIGGMLQGIMQEGVSIEDKIGKFVDTYTDLLSKNPFLPNFIFGEITRNPDGLIKRFASADIKPNQLLDPLQRQLNKEGYTIHPHDFILNLLSMVIFPVVARPIVERIFFEGDHKAYKEYLLSRKLSIVDFVMKALQGYK